MGISNIFGARDVGRSILLKSMAIGIVGRHWMGRWFD
jgi:hypothetical protein